MKDDNTDSAREEIIFPTALEMKAAQAACCGKCCLSCETPAAYAWRRRDVDMALLLQRAVEEELTEAERESVRLVYYEGLSLTAAAECLKIGVSAVSKTVERAQQKLYDALKYAVFYQRSTLSETVVHSALKQARAIAAARNTRAASFGGRLAALRIGENLSAQALAKQLHIGRARLGALENGTVQPLPKELIKFSEYFGKTTDYLLKGDVYV